MAQVNSNTNGTARIIPSIHVNGKCVYEGNQVQAQDENTVDMAFQPETLVSDLPYDLVPAVSPLPSPRQAPIIRTGTRQACKLGK